MKMPKSEINGFIPTLNKMGYMTSSLDKYSTEWTRLCTNYTEPSLEIGAAYGIATLEALKNGSHVIANDIDERHLDILKSRVPEEFKSSLSLIPGKFPEDINVESESIGAILICRVLHFFNPSMIEDAFKNLSRWLIKGGTLVVVAETPYLKNFSNFIPVYENRVKNREKYPGFICDVMDFAPIRGKTLPKQMHFLDPEVLKRLAAENGFDIIDCATMPRSDFPEDLQLDGRESVGLIARKKS